MVLVHVHVPGLEGSVHRRICVSPRVRAQSSQTIVLENT